LREGEEEDAKKACDQADSKAAAFGHNQGEVQEDEVEVDINLLLEKERNKILNQRTRDAERAKAKTDREAQKVKDKTERDAKKGGRSGKSKAVVAFTCVATGFYYITITESPQARFLLCTALIVKTSADHITNPHGLYKEGFACTRVLFLWIPSIH
jgi:hypothetical protein